MVIEKYRKLRDQHFRTIGSPFRSLRPAYFRIIEASAQQLKAQLLTSGRSDNMASVTNLDQDMKRLRMSRYTPQAAKEVRGWIEDTLGEPLHGGDLLELLKDGTILCRLVNRALPPPGIKFKKSSMPFVQMENISHFLRACESPPFNMQAHDRFLTVDLFETKDPAQVLQCLTAFSRVANSLFPNKFPVAIGPKRNPNPMSPTHTGASNGSVSSDHTGPGSGRGQSNTKQPTSPGRSGTGRPQSQAFTGPSSILYSGYMGGASQGNQGISFGGRRQITTPAPFVPSLADKERRRREKEAEEEKARHEAEEAEEKRRREHAAQEEFDRQAEEKRWEEDARRLREEEKERVEQEKREWEEQERRWKAAEEERLREEKEAQVRPRGLSDARLRGQYLSEYKAEEKTRSRQTSYNDPQKHERSRIEDLERQLAEAQERERQYQEERKRRDGGQEMMNVDSPPESQPPPVETRTASPQVSNTSWDGDEREYLRKQHTEHATPSKPSLQTSSTASPLPAQPPSSRPLPNPASIPKTFASRPLPEPAAEKPVVSSRPLPNPEAYSAPNPVSASGNRTERFLFHNRPPPVVQAKTHHPTEMGFTSDAEKRAEDDRRVQSQTKTKAGGWASKSLLEREMERERERQREWEEAQKEIRNAPKDVNAGVGAGQSWDVNQYGFTGGDSQNRGDGGISFGAKRQIIGPRGPRPPPS